jgi:hypothetical protein
MEQVKQTAVQWCAGKLGDLEFYNSIGNFTAIEYIEEKIKIIEEAKEMEKKQIIDSINEFAPYWIDAEQYYNETFKSE